MKKTLLMAGVLSAFSISNAVAAPGYYAQYSGGNGEQAIYDYNEEDAAYSREYNSYGTPKTAQQKNTFKHFSIGFDYVVGSEGIKSKKTVMDSPLLGGDSYTADTNNFEDSLKSLNGNIGWRPFRYLGFEAFYQQSLSDNAVRHQEHYITTDRFAQAEYTVDYKAYGLDALIYIPAASWLDFIASVGYGFYDFDGEIKLQAYDASSASDNALGGESLKYSESKGALRYGAGAQIRLSEKLSFRGMYRYTSLGGEIFDDISEISFGVRYNFY